MIRKKTRGGVRLSGINSIGQDISQIKKRLNRIAEQEAIEKHLRETKVTISLGEYEELKRKAKLADILSKKEETPKKAGGRFLGIGPAPKYGSYGPTGKWQGYWNG